jgi:hypothetical protein
MRLNVLLPTATILAFAIFAPLLIDNGKCTRLNCTLTGALMLLCAASCVFFTLTDSFRSPTGRLQYGSQPHASFFFWPKNRWQTSGGKLWTQ